MYQFYNAHPKGLTVGDCVKRAITLASGMNYMDVQRELNRHKKITGAKAFNSDYNPHHYVETVLKAKKLSFPAVKGQRRMNGERFCKAYPKGSYILTMANHWSCCIDGIIYDTWDCSDKCVYTAYAFGPYEEAPLKNSYVVKPSHKDNYIITIYNNKGESYKEELNSSELKGFLRALDICGYTKRD